MTEKRLVLKEHQVMKMLLTLILVNLFNLIPRVAHSFAMLVAPDYNTAKAYNNLFWVVSYFISLLDFINATVHFFIFYFLSSKFKFTLLKLFKINDNLN